MSNIPRPLMRHRVIVCITVLTLLLYCWEWVWCTPKTYYSLAIALCQLVLIILAPCFPEFVFFANETLGVFVIAIPIANTPSGIFISLLALGLIAYRQRTSIVIAALLWNCATQIFAVLSPYSRVHWLNVPSFIVIYLLIALLGRSLRWISNRFEQQLQYQFHEQQQRNTYLEQRIHDSVTGELSFIARLAQQQIRSVDGTEWRQVRDSAREALRQVRQVIDTLDQTDKSGDDNPTAVGQLDHIRSVMLQGDQAAHAVNMHGRGLLHVIGNCPLKQKQEQLIIDMLNEVYANILRHAPDGSSFELSVLMDLDAVQITQLNPMPEQDTGNGMPRSGRGLANLRKRVEHVGGRLIARPENGDWTFYAVIPVSA